MATLPTFTGEQDTQTATAAPTAPQDSGIPQNFNFLQGYGAPAGSTATPTAPPDKTVEDFQRRMEEVNKAVSSPWPTILSIAAALKGDFRPAFQLQEQKRQTAIGLKLTPLFQEARKKAIQGDTEGAQNMLNEIGGQYAGRAPEFAQLVSKASEEIAKKTQTLQADKSLLQALQDKVKERPELESAYAGELRTMKYHVGSKTPLAPKVHDEIAQKLGLKTQIIGEQIYEEGPSGVVSRPIRQVTRIGDVDTPIGMVLASKYGMNPAELTNAVNTPYGFSPEVDQIKSQWAQLQPFRALLEINKGIVIEPTLLYQHLTKYGAWETALRTFGDSGIEAILNQHNTGAKPGELRLPTGQGVPQPGTVGGVPTPAQRQGGEDIVTAQQRRQVELAESQELAKVKAERQRQFETDKAGKDLVDMTPTLDRFGRNRNAQMMTVDDIELARRNGEQIAPIDKKVNETIVQPGMKALRSFDLLRQMYAAYNNPKTLLDRSQVALARTVAEYLGVPTGKGVTVGAAINLLVDRAIEEVGSTIKIDNAKVRTLKNLMTGKGADMQQALDTVPLLQNQIADTIESNTGVRVRMEWSEPSPTKASVPGYLGGKGVGKPVPQAPTQGPKSAAPGTDKPVDPRIQKLIDEKVLTPLPEQQGRRRAPGGSPASQRIGGAQPGPTTPLPETAPATPPAQVSPNVPGYNRLPSTNPDDYYLRVPKR